METRRKFRFWMHHKVGFLLIFFIEFGFCLHVSSSLTKVARGEPNSDSNNLNISSHCSFNEYIMKSYFEKYEGLLESNFKDFVANEPLFSSCKLLPDDVKHKLSIPERQLLGEGSHRHLSSTVRFHFQPESLSQLRTHFCHLIIIERLPSGVFADPFELQHLLHCGVYADIAVFGDANLELPSFRSNHSAVEIHMKVDTNILLGQVNQLEITINLPLHARYSPLDESGYSIVEFGAPDLLISCCIEGDMNNQSCIFMPTTDIAEPRMGTVVWRIPSGKRTHAELVSYITFVTAFVSTLLIILTSMFDSNIKSHKNPKQE